MFVGSQIDKKAGRTTAELANKAERKKMGVQTDRQVGIQNKKRATNS